MNKNNIKLAIIRIYSISVMIPIIIIVIITSLYFKNFFNNEVNLERNSYLEFITTAINNSYANTQDLSQLVEYASNYMYFNINIYIYDENMNLIDMYESIEETNKNKNSFVFKIFNIEYDDHVIGYIKYKYIPDLYDINNTFENNKKTAQNVNRIFLTSTLVTIIIMSCFLLFFIRSITNPILRLTYATEEIIDKKYDKLKLPDTKIYELKKLSNNIAYLAANLKIQDQLRKTYSQDINHELRTPLTNLQLTLEAMYDDVIELSKENLQNSLNDINSLKVLIDNLKDSYNDEFTSLTLENNIFSLKNELELVSESFLPQFISKDVNLILETPYDQYLILDKYKLNQILNNLLSNSLKACSSGDTVYLGFKKQNNQINLYIKDTGRGISKENLQFVFNRFFRAENDITSNKKGHGLGLAIVKNLVDIMDLEIDVKSILGKETEFTIIIPSNKYYNDKI
ncbi:HAMP domain-containing histidine kinase [Peptostreptococcaceae bacterium OttesenSCG-928-C18]|nr:HAMP domain-containing histidine kinase [Peptostreptococcaceae bacterium OttesenSCG-928-C18]